MAKPHVYPAPLSVDVIYPSDTYAFNKPDPTVLDVERSFRSLKLDGNYLAAWDGAQMQRYRYTSSILNGAGRVGLQSA